MITYKMTCVIQGILCSHYLCYVNICNYAFPHVFKRVTPYCVSTFSYVNLTTFIFSWCNNMDKPHFCITNVQTMIFESFSFVYIPFNPIFLDLVQPFRWCTPNLLDGFNCKSKGDDNGRRRSWGALPGSQHFRGRGVCWSFGMGTRKIDKQVNYSHGTT